MSSQLFGALKWVMFFFVAILFCLRTYHFVDPDLGWHLKAGEIVATNHWTPPTTDPWSFALPAHDWVDHEWLVDGIFYQADAHGVWWLMVTLFTLLALIPPFVWFKRSTNILAMLLSLLASGLLLSVVGVRPQVLSLVFFFLSYQVLLSNSERIKKLVLFSPLFFWIWANLHAGFPAGLLLFGIVIFEAIYAFIFKKHDTERVVTAKDIRKLLGLFTLSTIATLLTPYHHALWWEIITSSINPLNSYINEWASPLYELSPMGVGFIALAIAMVGAQWKTFARAELFVVCFFVLLYGKHLRMLPFFLIAITPLGIVASNYFFSALSKTRILVKGYNMVTFAIYDVLIMATLVVYPYFALGSDVASPYQPSRDAFAALSSIEQRYPLGNVYNSYGLGGWLIHDRVGGKVFTDGRSPHWRDASGFSPFETQINIEKHGKDFRPTFNRFNIHTVIILNQPDSEQSQFGTTTEFANRHPKLFSVMNDLLIGEHVMPLRERLRNDGWCTLYQDNEVVIMSEDGTPLCHPLPKLNHYERFVFTGRAVLLF